MSKLQDDIKVVQAAITAMRYSEYGNIQSAFNGILAELALLQAKNKGLEDVDEVAAGYRDLCKKMIADMWGEGLPYANDYEHKFEEIGG